MNLHFDYDINSQQQIIINELIDKHQITGNNVKILLKYYKHFLKLLHLQNNEKAQKINKENHKIFKSLAQVSLIFTQKSNFYKTIEGVQFPGICFSMNEILKNKSYNQIEDLINITKNILALAKFKENVLKFEVDKLIQEIQIGLNEAIMFEKFILVFLRNTLETSADIIKYKQKIIIYAWYLYIDAKNNIIGSYNMDIKQLLKQKKYLMLSVIQTIILYSLSQITPLILQKGSPKPKSLIKSINTHRKFMIENIIQILFEESKMQSNQLFPYQNINQIFDTYFDYLIEASIIKPSNYEQFNILSYENLDINFRKIDRKISKEINFNQIDLRKFISYDLNYEKDCKRTAMDDKINVKNKKYSKKRTLSRPENSERTYKSHKVLNLDVCDLGSSNSSLNDQSEIHLPSYVSTVGKINIPLLHRVTQKDELSIYLMQSTRPFISQPSSYEQSIMNFIQRVFENLNQKSSNYQFSYVNCLQSYQFYEFLAYQTWSASSNRINPKHKLQQTESMHKCLLVISLYTISNNHTKLENIQDFFSTKCLNSEDWSDMFYASTYLLGTKIPRQFQHLLSNLKRYIVNVYFWSDRINFQILTDMFESLIYSENNYQVYENESIKCIVQSLVKYINKQIDFFAQEIQKNCINCNKLLLKRWKSKVILMTLSMIIFEPEIIQKRILDQIFICNMFAASKLLKFNLKFQQIISIYKIYTRLQPTLFNNVIFDIAINQQQVFKNIINYYNLQFIKYLTGNSPQRQCVIFNYLSCNFLMSFCNDSYEVLNNEIHSPMLGSEIHKMMIFSPEIKQLSNYQNQQNYEYNNQFNNNQNYQYNHHYSNQSNIEQNSQYHHQQNKYYHEYNNQYNNCSSILQYNSRYYDFEKQNQQQHSNKQKNQINNKMNRNPTRIKERKSLYEKESELCATQKVKHPIFDEFRNQNVEEQKNEQYVQNNLD